MKLNTLYTNILAYCGMRPNADDAIDILLGDEDVKPATIEGRRLVMPTQAQLKAYHPDKVVIFHPLQEHVNRGESEVVKKLRSQLNVRINYAIVQIASELLKLAASPALHARLSPEQRELLKAVANADLKSAANFVSFIMKPFTEAPGRCITNVYLKKAGTYKGTKHSRVGIVTFPYYELFDGVKLRANDQIDFVKLMEFMFPGSHEDAEAYNAYSDSNDAPWLDAALKTSYTLTQRLNELIEMYADHIENAESLMFNDDWVEAMDDVEQFRSEIRRIPSQKGNEGTIQTETGTDQSTMAPAPGVIVPARPTPASRPPTEDGMDAYRQAAAAPQPLPYPPQGQPPGYPYPPPPNYPYPSMQPPPPPQGLATTETGKLDFRSISAVNPAVAMAGMVQTPLSDWAQRNDPRNWQGQPQAQVDPRFGGRVLAGNGYPPPPLQQWGQPVYPAQYPQQQPAYPQYPQQQVYQQPVYPQQNYGYPPPINTNI